MNCRIIKLNFDRTGAPVSGDFNGEALELFVHETCQISCRIYAAGQEGNFMELPGEDAYEAGVFRCSDGRPVLRSATWLGSIAVGGRAVSVTLDTGDGPCAAAAADPDETFVFRIFHYPAGEWRGEVLISMPAVFSRSVLPGGGEASPWEHPELPDRTAGSPAAVVPGVWRWRNFSGKSSVPVRGRVTVSPDVSETFRGADGADPETYAAPVLFHPASAIRDGAAEYRFDRPLRSAVFLAAPAGIRLSLECEIPFRGIVSVCFPGETLLCEAEADGASGSCILDVELPGSIAGRNGFLSLEYTPEDFSVIPAVGEIFLRFPADAALPPPDYGAEMVRFPGTVVFCRCAGGFLQRFGIPGTTVPPGVGIRDGAFGGDAGWGMDTGVDLREIDGAWSIFGKFRTASASGSSRRIICRAGDPLGGPRSCLAGVLAQEDGEGGCKVIFRCNVGGSVIAAEIPVTEGFSGREIAFAAVFDPLRGRIGVISGGESWCPMAGGAPRALPERIPGTGHPGLEIGCAAPDRRGADSAGVFLKSFGVVRRALDAGEAAAIHLF